MTREQAAAVLGVPVGAAGPVLKTAYRAAAMVAHPDKGGTAAAFQRVQEAYEVLTGEREATATPAGSARDRRPREPGPLGRLVRDPATWERMAEAVAASTEVPEEWRTMAAKLAEQIRTFRAGM